ncbi:hypothetical protein L7F22_027061 [Adiantum nelumboides]|nr:hypothetical protein [Adiantum nelumboides]
MADAESLVLPIPTSLEGVLKRPILKPTLIPNWAARVLPNGLEDPKVFEDHTRNFMGDIEVCATDNEGNALSLPYNAVLDGCDCRRLALLDQCIPKGNPLLQLLDSMPMFEDDIHKELKEVIGFGDVETIMGILYTDKSFFTASHVDHMCTMGWMLLLEGRKTFYFWDGNDQKVIAAWESCLNEGRKILPRAQYHFVVEAGSLVYIPPGDHPAQCKLGQLKDGGKSFCRRDKAHVTLVEEAHGVNMADAESLILPIPTSLEGVLKRPILKPTLIPNWVARVLSNGLADPKVFEDHTRNFMGDIEVCATDNEGNALSLPYNAVLDGCDGRRLALLDQCIPKGNPLLQLLDSMPMFEDDIHKELKEFIGFGDVETKMGILYTDKSFFTASHVDHMCTMGWMLLLEGRKTFYFWDGNDQKVVEKFLKISCGMVLMIVTGVSLLSERGIIVIYNIHLVAMIGTKEDSFMLHQRSKLEKLQLDVIDYFHVTVPISFIRKVGSVRAKNIQPIGFQYAKVFFKEDSWLKALFTLQGGKAQKCDISPSESAWALRIQRGKAQKKALSAIRGSEKKRKSRHMSEALQKFGEEAPADT